MSQDASVVTLLTRLETETRNLKLVLVSRDDLPYDKKAIDAMDTLLESIPILRPKVERMMQLAPNFDFNQSNQANGYRTLISIVEKAVSKILENLAYFSLKPVDCTGKLQSIVKARAFIKDFFAFSALLPAFIKLFDFLALADSYKKPDEIMVFLNKFSRVEAKKLYDVFDDLPRACFYGRTIGFHYEKSLSLTYSYLVATMQTHAEIYERDISHGLQSVIYGGKFVLNNKLRGFCMEYMSRFCDIKFCKSFWCLAEYPFVQQLTQTMVNAVGVDNVIVVDGEPLKVPLKDGSGYVTVKMPEETPLVSIRLLSFEAREDMLNSDSSSKPKQSQSTKLLLHIHGGGFVAQSSKSHSVYLRSWAKELTVPIVSIDYDLAPECPFPIASQQCFYIYCWCKLNSEKLGSTCEQICIAGDSAGGNLSFSTIINCIQQGIAPPIGMISVYPCVLLQYSFCPSRLLSLMDCLLSIGVLDQCIMAYVGKEDPMPKFKISKVLNVYRGEMEDENPASNENGTNFTKWLNYLGKIFKRLNIEQSLIRPVSSFSTVESASEDIIWDEYVQNLRGLKRSALLDVAYNPITQDPRMSPLLTPDEILSKFPPCRFVIGSMDPFLDETILMAKKLVSLKVSTTLDVIKDLPHGFLNFVIASRAAKEASDLCIAQILDIFGSRNV